MSRFLITLAILAVLALVAVDISQEQLPAEVSYDNVALRADLSTWDHAVAFVGFEVLDWEITDYGVVRFAERDGVTLIADPVSGKWHTWR